jgi:hypothetical protein
MSKMAFDKIAEGLREALEAIKADDIPQDIRAHTREILDGYFYGQMSPDEAISKALLAERMAERERCAAAVDPGKVEWTVPAEGSPVYFAGYRQGLAEAARIIRAQP